MEEELWEEEFIERCVLELLEEEEQWEWFIPSRDLPSLQDQISLRVLDVDADADFDVVVSQQRADPSRTRIPHQHADCLFLSAGQQQSEPQRQGVRAGHPETRHVTLQAPPPQGFARPAA